MQQGAAIEYRTPNHPDRYEQCAALLNRERERVCLAQCSVSIAYWQWMDTIHWVAVLIGCNSSGHCSDQVALLLSPYLHNRSNFLDGLFNLVDSSSRWWPTIGGFSAPESCHRIPVQKLYQTPS